MKRVRREGTVRVEDAEIYFRVVGEGRPLVLLHGNGEDHTAFRAQIQRFRGEYQLVLIDSRGHGKSSLGCRGLNFSLMANDILQVLNYLGIEAPVILGFSDGANLALQYAVLYPKRLSALIAVSGNWSPRGMKFWFYQGVKWMYFWWRLAAHFHWKARCKKELYGLMALHPKLTEEELKGITVPALVIAADKDMIRESHTRKLAGLLPDARLKIIKNANHMSIYGRPEAYNLVIHRFLQDLEKKDDAL